MMLFQLSIWGLTFAYAADGGFSQLNLDFVVSHTYVFGLVLLGLACTQILKHQEKGGYLAPVRYTKLGWFLNIFAALIGLYVMWDIGLYVFYMEAMGRVGFVMWITDFAWAIISCVSTLLIALISLTMSRQLSVSLAAQASDHKP